MSKSLLIPLSDYQKDRVRFVQKIADLSSRPQNIESLYKSGVISLLRPLLLDSVPSVQQNAALAIGRMANYSEEIAESVVQSEIIAQLIFSLSKSNRFLKKSACFIFKSIAKHSPNLADSLIKGGVLPPLTACLEEFDPSVKEAACLALGFISKHNASLAYQVVQNNSIIDNIILCLQEPEILLKRSSSLALSFIAQHNEKYAQLIAERGLDTIILFITYCDTQLKRNITQLLGNLCKHSQDLSSQVLAKLNGAQKLLSLLKDPDDIIKKNTSYCICEIVNKSPENAQAIVNSGGPSFLVDYITNIKGDPILYGILSLGFISAYSNTLAWTVITAKAIKPIRNSLQNEPHQHIKAAACYALGHIGRHTAKHSNEICNNNVLSLMLYYYLDPKSNEDLKIKAKESMKKIIDSSENLEALSPLIICAPQNILKHILQRFAIVLKGNNQELKRFIENGGLQKLQEIKEKSKAKNKVLIDDINSLYPENIIKYYSPDYAVNLLNKLEKYSNEDNK